MNKGSMGDKMNSIESIPNVSSNMKQMAKEAILKRDPNAHDIVDMLGLDSDE